MPLLILCFHLLVMHFTDLFFDTRVGVVEFQFDRLVNAAPAGYHVAVCDEPDSCFGFAMEEKQGEWRIASTKQLPEWITDFESLLSDSIHHHLARKSGHN